MLSATPLYAGLLTLLFLVLSYRVVMGRHLHAISVGDQDNKDMIKRMRAQANWVEYAPIGIILLAFLELQEYPIWLIHVLGLTLLAGRISHAYGFGHTPQIVPFRKLGMYLTLTALLAGAILNIWAGLPGN